MATHKERRTDRFEIEYRGKTYPCERIISGTNSLTQQIYVVGVGSKHNSARYGRDGHPMETMVGIARMIAREILVAATI